jgi:membrane-associated phospholipid phosphatase
MAFPQRLRVKKLISVLRVNAIVFFIAFSQYATAQNWDINTVKALNPENPDSKFFRGISSSVYVIGISAPVGLLTAGLISGDSLLKRKSYEMFAAALIELAVTGGIKNIVNRQRPVEKYPLDVFPYASYSGKSIPSGHTSMAFATSTSLWLQFRKWYIVIPSYLWATTVGYSRIYLGVHYPSDVIAGAVVGAGSAYLAHWLNRKIFQKPSRFKHR